MAQQPKPLAKPRPAGPLQVGAKLPFLPGGGEMGERIRQHHWSGTELGPPAAWPPHMLPLVALMLASTQPMFLVWGPAQRFLYNDAFVPILGRKHPAALGRPALEVWAEAREDLAPLFARVYSGEPVHSADIRLRLDRRGSLEEAHFAFSYTPARDARGEVAGLFGACVETTEQKLAEGRQVRERDRQRRLFEQAPGFIVILQGPRHVVEFANEAFARLAGYRQLLGLAVRDAFPELHDQGFFELLDRVYASGEQYLATGVPVRLRTGSGQRELRHLDFVYAPILDEAGVTTGIFVEGHDVTVAYRARAELRANERRQALLVELNDRLRDLDDPADLSYASAELLGKALKVSRAGYGTIHPASETLVIERDWNAPGIRSLAGVLHFRDYGSYIEDLKRGETVVFADATKDPRTRERAAALEAISARAVVNMPVTEHNGLVALLYLNHATARDWLPEELAFAREVAERTRLAVARRSAEQDLRRLTASLERLVAERTAERDRVWRNSRDLLLVCGIDGILRDVNPAWTLVLGHAHHEVVGRSLLDFVWPEDLELARDGLRAALGPGRPTDSVSRFRHVDGSPRWLSWHTAVERDTLYAYGHDITAQREQAEALRKAEDVMRQRQKLEAMGQLTGGVAHDFNNLLAVVSNNVYLHRRLSPACEHSPQLAAIARATDTGAKLTRQLLAFARRQAIRPEPILLQRALPELHQVLQASFGGRIEIRVTIDEDTPVVRADRSELELAIINLAMNARDAMPDGGVLSIRARRAAPASADAAPEAAIDVSDTGHGIPPEILSRVFEPFFTTKSPGRGTGLGLSQVYGFATQAGGRLDLASRPGAGTSLTVVLPGTDEAPAAAAPPKAPLRSGLDARILVVEDNVEVGSATRELLEVAGCEVVHLDSGDRALAWLQSPDAAPVDLVLTDIVMPGEVSGVTLARWIGQARPGLPVLLATGYSAELAAASELGLRVLRKPVNPEALIDAVRLALGSDRGAAPQHSGRRD